ASGSEAEIHQEQKVKKKIWSTQSQVEGVKVSLHSCAWVAVESTAIEVDGRETHAGNETGTRSQESDSLIEISASTLRNQKVPRIEGLRKDTSD
ncbi:unnamed protein product, partial [Mycena citricolor]